MQGLVLPPRVAPTQVVLVPIVIKAAQREVCVEAQDYSVYVNC